MNTYYILSPTNSDIVHFGKGHDDNPPGRGSGRFPFGSGKRPKQHVEPAKPKDKETVLKSGKAHDVLSMQTEFTNQELRDAVNRMQSIDDLKKYDARQRQSRWDKVNAIMKRAGDVVNWTSTGIRAWNNFAAIYNAAISGDPKKTKLPGISMPNTNNPNANNQQKDKKG